MKKSKKSMIQEIIENTPVTVNVEPTTTVETKTETIMETVKAALGRPVDPNSVRQQRLKELEAKRAAGLCKRGRPVVANSERQQRLAERAAKVANGGELKRGRPIVADSERQKRLAAQAARAAAHAQAIAIAAATVQA